MSEIYWDTKSVEWWKGRVQVEGPLIKLAIAILKSEGIYSVLDVGCGISAYRSTLSFPRYYGVDIASHAILEAQRLNPHCKFYTGDFRNIQLPEVDAAVVFNVLGHLSSYEEALEKLFSITELVVVIFVKKLNQSETQIIPRVGGYYDNVYSRNEIAKFCETLGWQVNFFDGVRKIIRKGPLVSTLGYFRKSSSISDDEFYTNQAFRSKPIDYSKKGCRLLREVDKLIGYLKDAGFEKPKIIDAGCRDGWLTQHCGNVVVGIECVKAVVERAVSLGRNVLCGDLDRLPKTNPNLFENKFHGVFMSHAIEHVRDPKQVLTHLQELLTVKGLIYIIVPDKPTFGHNSSHLRAVPFAEKLLSFLPLGLRLLHFEHRLKDKEIVAILQKYRV